MKFIADENIAPETIEFIRNLGYDIIDIYQAKLSGRGDIDVIEFAEKHNRTIIVFAIEANKGEYPILF